jgi:hypothetical protein
MRPDKGTEAASKLLGDVVRFIREGGVPVRAIVGRRWATKEEWALFLRRKLPVAAVMIPPPERGRREQVCPCPGCGRCCCEWVGAGGKACRRAKRCACPHVRAPVRLDFRRTDMERGELVLTHSGAVLCTLGVWSSRAGWDLSLAGAAKEASLRAVLPAALARHGTLLAARAAQAAGAPPSCAAPPSIEGSASGIRSTLSGTMGRGTRLCVSSAPPARSWSVKPHEEPSRSR